MKNKPMDRRDFLKATAGTGLAAAMASGTSLAEAIGADKPASTGEKFAFFDTCCLHPDKSNSKFVLGNGTDSIMDVLEKIHAKAEQLGSPMLSLTCLGLQRESPSMSTRDTVAKCHKKNEMAFVALDASPKEVKRAILCRRIFLQRYGYSTPGENVREHAADVFLYNHNAPKIIQGLGERHWLVFGRGFQYCTASVIVGLLALGKKVTVLEDAILTATGKGDSIENFERTKKYVKSLGAQFARFDSVFA